MNDDRTRSLGPKGTVRAWLELRQDAVRWDEDVTGCIRLLGGREKYRIYSMGVVLKSASGLILSHKDLLSGPSSVPRWKTIEYPFRLRVPWGAPLSEEVSVAADITSGMWFDVLRAPVEIRPPAEFETVVADFAREAEMTVRGWAAIAGGDGAAADLAPEAATSFFDGAQVRVLPGARVYQVELILDLKAGLIASLTRVDRHHTHVQIPRHDLGTAAPQFREVLETVRQRLGPERDLPIPAEAPPSGMTTLPIPGVGPQDSAGERA